jgi:allantoicase
MAISALDPNAPEFTRRYINLADARLGAQAVSASDEFFAPLSRMLNPEPAVFIVGKYDDHGKWMDGWETRRKRSLGHDMAVVKLARRGVIHGVDIDTSHFTGNFPPAASLEACDSVNDPDHSTSWTVILDSVNLQGNSHHYHPLACDRAYTHIRLHIYPDGGIARLRVYGQPQCDWSAMATGGLVDLAAAENGAYVAAVNNQHFGLASNMLMPGRGLNMGDGWETRRRREPGHDWCVIALARPGIIERIDVDTAHFKGNYPDRCSIQAARVEGGTDTSLITQSMFWPVLLPEQKLQMDLQHSFDTQIHSLGGVSHVRLNIHPDGGVSRLRLWGRLEV